MKDFKSAANKKRVVPPAQKDKDVLVVDMPPLPYNVWTDL